MSLEKAITNSVEFIDRNIPKVQETGNKIGKFTQDHLMYTTPQVLLNLPFFSIFDTNIANLSDISSMEARGYSIGLAVAGIGYAVGKLRDTSKNTFKAFKGMRATIHDTAFIGTAYAILGGIPVALTGDAGFEEVLKTGGTIGLYGALIGRIMGETIDTFREALTPPSFNNNHSEAKSLFPVALLTASLCITGVNYNLTQDQGFENKVDQISKNAVEQLDSWCEKKMNDPIARYNMGPACIKF